ncbi:hypothetical protein N0V94_001054 [Neodidymelliopsis sp. IMI 364377]|nr:hypothetical protein N0V94_001054 [Neodidymelliopsis sp. IMI 364377]
MSENTEEQEIRLTRHHELQNGMELILGKLRHDAKSITTEDARSLADNTEDGDEQTADIIAALADIAARNEAERTTINDDHPRSSGHTSQSAFSVSEEVIERLRNDPSSITEEDARRFSENVEVTNPTSARLVSAVESLAAAHNDIYSKNINLGQSPHPSLLTVVKDLHAAVEANPEDINTEILKTTQSIVSKMQKAVGHTNAPHPELEAELQQEYAKIVPKVERGVVTKAEADHLHSLEARAHGHTERGGITAIAQSVAARRGRQASVSSGTGGVRSRANSKPSAPHQPSLPNAEQISHKAQGEPMKTANDIVGQQDTDSTHSQQYRAHGHLEKRKVSAMPPTVISARRYQSLSDSTNTTRASGEDVDKYSSMNSRLAGLSVYNEEIGISMGGTVKPKQRTCGSGDMGSGGSENMPHTHKREDSHSTV